ncbi:MAG: GAF domain-containing protein, partial [Chloroflexi bacterium]|nr:GAF domain-containing protein [Chloroflexota bacterium]
IQSGQPGVSNLLRLPSTESVGVLFAAPILHQDGIVGAVVGEMRLPNSSISSGAAALHLGSTGHLEIVDGNRLVLASTDSDDDFVPTEHPEFYRALLESRTAAVGRAYYTHVHQPELRGTDEWHIMAFAPLTTAPWGVGLGQNETETFAAARDLRNRALTVAALALAAALCLSWLGTQSVVRPIRALTRAGERMATGDLSRAIRIDQTDELGRLGEVLETMRSRLGQSLAQVSEYSRDLEQRVHARTLELQTSNRHLQALMAVATTSARGGDREELLQGAMRELVDTLELECAWASYWDDTTQQLHFVSGYQVPDSLQGVELRVSAPGAACVMAVKEARSVWQPMAQCPAMSPEQRAAFEGRTCWCVPIKIGEKCLGSVCLTLPPGRRFDADEVALAHGVAQQVAIAFENARLTEERALLEASRRLELLRTEFLGSVSHELRTPLGFIKGYTTTLLRPDVVWDDSDRRDFLQIIDEEADHLAELVDNLLEAARLQAGRLRLRYENVEVEHVLRRAIGRMVGSLEKHRIQLHVEATPTIVADGRRLEQVAVNLLQNAVKYSPDGGPVDVYLRAADGGAEIGVVDQGLGITEEDAARIFEPFYRATNGQTAGISGTGLGLAICRAIVEAHGGRIWAEARPERGMAIHLTLPVRAQGFERSEHVSEARIGS